MSSPLLTRITRLFSGLDVAVDLGTANTRLFAAGAGLVADIPTKVNIMSRKRLADSDSSALNNAGRKSEFVMPLRGGVIKNVPAATFLLKKLLKRTRRFGLPRLRVIVCAPSDVSERERAVLVEAVRQAGASSAAVVPEPLAGAIGAGLDISSPYAQMVVDIGAGVTDIAVIRDGNLIQTAATRMAAGSDLHRAVQKMTAMRYGVELSRKEAEILTRKLGAVYSNPLPDSLKIYGVRDCGRKIQISVESHDVCEAIRPVVGAIVETIRRAVREMSPEACAEVIETGICLTGGVAELPGLAELIAEQTNLPVVLAPAPLYSVIEGASRMLETSAKTRFWQSCNFSARSDR
jgi:rod shape-determining protein MreB